MSLTCTLKGCKLRQCLLEAPVENGLETYGNHHVDKHSTPSNFNSFLLFEVWILGLLGIAAEKRVASAFEQWSDEIVNVHNLLLYFLRSPCI